MSFGRATEELGMLMKKKNDLKRPAEGNKAVKERAIGFLVKRKERLSQKQKAEAWAETWDALVKDIRKRNESLPPLTEEEIVAECKAIRRQLRAERAKDNHRC